MSLTLDQHVRDLCRGPVVGAPPLPLPRRLLGPHAKSSACFWPTATTTLAEAERAMLHLTCVRAGIEDGMEVLELGCGWGALALWIAEHHPACRVTAVATTDAQARFVRRRARRRGLDNAHVVVGDFDTFESAEAFDLVTSVEEFDRVSNPAELLARIARWTRPGGALFVQLAGRRGFVPDDERQRDAGASLFARGGVLTSQEVLPRFQMEFRLQRTWHEDGRHAARTAHAWLARLDDDRHRRLRAQLEAAAEAFESVDERSVCHSHLRLREPWDR